MYIATLGIKAEEKGIELHSQHRAFDAGYFCDPTRLYQVLVNLLSNAVKFTERGHVTLQCDVTPKNEQIDILRFSIRDTGIGIKREALDKIFENFSQAEQSTTRKYMVAPD